MNGGVNIDLALHTAARLVGLEFASTAGVHSMRLLKLNTYFARAQLYLYYLFLSHESVGSNGHPWRLRSLLLFFTT